MEIITAIKKIPLDYVEKIFENGIVLTGGGSLIYGLDKMMSKVLGITVNQPTDPIDSVAKGLSRINTLIPLKGRSTNKNVTSLVLKYYLDSKKAEG
jgi:actin-like ATPase involved in cell morphogenesis